MAYTRPGESGRYIWGGDDYVDFTTTTVPDDDIDVFICKLYGYTKNGDSEFWERYHHGNRIIGNWLFNRMNVKKHDKYSGSLEKTAEEISALAKEIWEEHYTPIIGAEQVEYMLSKYRSAEQIHADIRENDYIYFTANCEKKHFMIGYCAVLPKEDHLFISKIYVHKDRRGRGISSSLLNEIYALCRWNYNFDKVRLTVNKNNANTIEIYKKKGFEVVDSVKTDIGNGFFMDDYIMEKHMVFPENNEDMFEKKELNLDIFERLGKNEPKSAD